MIGSVDLDDLNAPFDAMDEWRESYSALSAEYREEYGPHRTWSPEVNREFDEKLFMLDDKLDRALGRGKYRPKADP